MIAILLTVMVLELPKAAGPNWGAIAADLPVLLASVLSLVHLGIDWNNHHQLFQAGQRVSGTVLWANLHLLFRLSLVPFVIGWITDVLNAKDEPLTVPLAAYGVVLMLAGGAYRILQRALTRAEGPWSMRAVTVGRDLKGTLSVPRSAVGIARSLVGPVFGVAVFGIYRQQDQRWHPARL